MHYYHSEILPCTPQARQPLPGLEVVAAARERCVDKIEQVEEIEYDEVVSLILSKIYL